MLYLDVRYEGGTHGVTGMAEPNLVLTDDWQAIDDCRTGLNETVAYMGKLSVLLQWHEEDPVDLVEEARHEVVASAQGNRNPFIDQPDWVICVFELGPCGEIFLDGFESGDVTAWSAVVPPPATCVPAGSCCRICTSSKACGDSCINVGYNCNQPPGCACNASDVCP